MHNRTGIGQPRSQKQKGESRICGNFILSALLTLPLALAGLAAGATARAAAPVLARASRSLTVNDEGHLHLINESGAYLIEEGKVSGTLVGRVRVTFDVSTTVTASFVLYPNGGGSLTGHGVGKLRSSGRYASFGGSMWVSSGTGRFSHASGQGGLYGTILREGSFPVVVQTRGTLHY
jgi:hypothetical protein